MDILCSVQIDDIANRGRQDHILISESELSDYCGKNAGDWMIDF